MEKYLSILEAPGKQKEKFNVEKIKFFSSKISIWNFFGVPQSSYLALSTEEKSAMFRQYYNKLESKFHGQSGKLFFVCVFGLHLLLLFDV